MWLKATKYHIGMVKKHSEQKEHAKRINAFYINSYFCYDVPFCTQSCIKECDWWTGVCTNKCTEHCPSHEGIAGIASTGAACLAHLGWAVNINEYNTKKNAAVKSAKTFVHELGHNLGMFHDFAPENNGTGDITKGCPGDGKGLMSYGEKPDRWSKCSNANFKDFWYGIGQWEWGKWGRRVYPGCECLKSSVFG